uniref:Uncharacterized protein n=1 Tax=Rhizophora mucronata TaxID=61149 RepID=A0A2P2NVK5_RHIMU
MLGPLQALTLCKFRSPTECP